MLNRTSLLAAVAAAALPALSVLAAATPAQAAPTDIRINEVITTGSVNDSIELVNTGTASVDVSGWVLKDNDNTHSYTIASGTSIAPGGFRAFDVSAAYGLGSADSARLFQGSTLIDTHTWSSHSNLSWSRCADGTDSFTQSSVVTLGSANSCPAPAIPWPGGSSVSDAQAANAFGSDMSGLATEGTGVLWASQNSGKMWRLVPNGSGGWKADTANGWSTGKTLRFPSGTGAPDAESVTTVNGSSANGLFTAIERDGSGSSRLSVLRYDVSGTGSTLVATWEWNLTADLPSVGSNLGLEGIAWVPDSYLTGAGFVDSSTGQAYNPAAYPAHTGGVFFVGVEGTGMVHGYVLEEAGGFTRVASVASGFPAVMELEWEPQASRLWVVCDDNCQGNSSTFAVDGSGALAATATYARPAGMANLNNEGFALAPAAQCVGGSKPAYWSDDSNTGGIALRAGTVNC